MKVLQDRFDDQSVTLRLTKESVGGAQVIFHFPHLALTLRVSICPTGPSTLREQHNLGNVNSKPCALQHTHYVT